MLTEMTMTLADALMLVGLPALCIGVVLHLLWTQWVGVRREDQHRKVLEQMRAELTTKQRIIESQNSELSRLNRKVRESRRITTMDDLKYEQREEAERSR